MSISRANARWRGAIAVLAGLSAMTASAVAAPGGRPGTAGNYDLVFNGDFVGAGTAKVNPAHVNITADLQGVDGPGGTLKVKNLRIDDSRFDGTGTLDGKNVEVSGRVDAPEGGLVKVARLSFTVRTPDGKVARAFGELTPKKP